MNPTAKIIVPIISPVGMANITPQWNATASSPSSGQQCHPSVPCDCRDQSWEKFSTDPKNTDHQASTNNDLHQPRYYPFDTFSLHNPMRRQCQFTVKQVLVSRKCAVISWDTSTHLAFQCPFSSFLWEFPGRQEPYKQEASTNHA